jgi:hypothetical protein
MSSATPAPDPGFASPVSAQGDVQSLPLGSQLVTAIQGRPVSDTAPANNDALIWWTGVNKWVPIPSLNMGYSGTQTLAGTLNAGGLKVNGLALPGTEIGYDQITSSVTVTSSASSSLTTVITAAAHTFDGQPVICEFFSFSVQSPSVSAGTTNILLSEGGSTIAQLGQVLTPAAAVMRSTILGRYRFTPSAGSHTYTIGAYASSTTGSPTVFAFSTAPAYLRFTKV